MPQNWSSRMTRLGNSQRMRRFAVLLWLGMLAFDPWVISRLARSYAHLDMLPALLLPTLTQLLIAWLAFRGMRISLAQPTLDDSAVQQYGSDFDALTDRQRDEVAGQRFHDFVLGRVPRDEREAELRLRAEGDAYRLLRPGLTLAVAAYWAICLLGPFAAIREPLSITAVAFTWIAVAILALPTMVRMWTQPNQVGELRIVATGKAP